MVTVIVVVAAGLVLFGLVVAAGHRVLRAGGSGGGAADALGNFIDVFDPARSRADQELKSQRHQGAIIPAPDDDDRPLRVDLASGRATVRRPR